MDVGANSEYWVSIAFYWGGGLSPGPTPQPLENDDDNGEDDKGWDDDNSATDDHHSKDGDDHNHGHGHHDDDDANTAGVAVGATFGVLAFLAIVIGGCFYCARTRGHSGPNSAFFSEVQLLLAIMLLDSSIAFVEIERFNLGFLPLIVIKTGLQRHDGGCIFAVLFNGIAKSHEQQEHNL